MKKFFNKVAELTATTKAQKVLQAKEVAMNPEELDSIGRLVINKEQGGLFTPSVDADIQGFKRTMNVVVRDNGIVALVPHHRKPSRARELAKTPHGKVSLMECGDVVVTFRFSASLVGKIEGLLLNETANILCSIAQWVKLGEKYFENRKTNNS